LTQILALIESLAVGWVGTTMAFQVQDEAELKRQRDARSKAITKGLRRMLTTAAKLTHRSSQIGRSAAGGNPRSADRLRPGAACR
jgi:hypothetical protein